MNEETIHDKEKQKRFKIQHKLGACLCCEMEIGEQIVLHFCLQKNTRKIDRATIS